MVLADTGSRSSVDRASTLSAVAGFDIEEAGLVAAHDSVGLNAGERDSKTEAAGEFSAAGNGQDNRRSGGLIERCGRDDEDGTMTPLLVTDGGIERHGVDVSTFHRSSRPTAGASTHSRSSGGCGCKSSEAASRSRSLSGALLRFDNETAIINLDGHGCAHLQVATASGEPASRPA